MNGTLQKPRPGFTLNDRGGRVRVLSTRETGKGTILVFTGRNRKPRRVHI